MHVRQSASRSAPFALDTRWRRAIIPFACARRRDASFVPHFQSFCDEHPSPHHQQHLSDCRLHVADVVAVLCDGTGAGARAPHVCLVAWRRADAIDEGPGMRAILVRARRRGHSTVGVGARARRVGVATGAASGAASRLQRPANRPGCGALSRNTFSTCARRRRSRHNHPGSPAITRRLEDGRARRA